MARMASISPFLALAVLLCTFSLSEAEGEMNTTYVVALLGQEIQNGTTNTDIKYKIVMTNRASNNITVTIRGVSGIICEVDIPVSHTKSYVVENSSLALNGSELTNKSLLVQSLDGPFVLQVFTKRLDTGYEEGYLGFPIEQLAGPVQDANVTVYDYVVTTFCAISGYCQLAVAALNNMTPIYIKTPANVDQISLCNKLAYFRTKRDTILTLNEFDVLQLETAQDLTGTHIYSYEPIVVFAGSRHVNNSGVIAHTVEQMVPSSHWGREYFVQTLGKNGYGDILVMVSTWSNTTVSMTGFSPFVIKNNYETAVRRLDDRTRSHIVTNHPVQIVQISGLTYATTGENTTLSMTVVPSVQQGWTSYTLSCYEQSDAARFFVVTEKGKTVNQSSLNDMKYTKYRTGNISSTGSGPYNVTGTGEFSGVLKCGPASTMPLGIVMNREIFNRENTQTPYKFNICYEGRKAKTVLDRSTASTTPHTINLNEHPDYVVKMRIRVCGQATLQFVTGSTFNDSLTITISNTTIMVKRCFPDCANGNLTVLPNILAQNVTDWDCNADMFFLWFQQKENKFCFGTNNTDCFDIPKKFVNVTMMGVLTDADFNWDLEHPKGCTYYDSDWRCSDSLANCSDYGTSLCSSNLAQFCAKYCGNCFADTYGNKFLVKVPYCKNLPSEECKIIVSPLNRPTNVAALKTKGDSSVTIVHGSSHDGVRYYDCSNSAFTDFYNITTDREVSVVVLFKKDNGMIKSYRVSPVDTFGKEFLVLTDGQVTKYECLFVSEFDIVMATVYYDLNATLQLLKKGAELSDSVPINLTSSVGVGLTGNVYFSGTQFIGDKPFSLFCSPSNYAYFYQMPPTNTWSKEYIVPAFDSNPLNRPFDAKLRIMSYTDNTVVNISGGFDAMIILYSSGDTAEQDIDATSSYRVIASGKIVVGILFFDPDVKTKQDFHILPSKENMHDTIVTSVPNTILTSMRFNVSSIKTYFGKVDATSVTDMMEEGQVSDFYRRVHLSSAMFGITVLQQNASDWFVIPNNSKSKVIAEYGPSCVTSGVEESDGLDNDCDGLIDEDLCYVNYGVYKEDFDLDGNFGDDCGRTISEPAVVTKPIDPMCLVIDKPADQCWTICSCKCSWVEKYNAQKNMTLAELQESLKDKLAETQSILTVNKSNLAKTKATKLSADDRRQSAANIGYVGTALLVLIFAFIVVLDASALMRDARILAGNLRDGFTSLIEIFQNSKGEPLRHEVGVQDTTELQILERGDRRLRGQRRQ